MSRDKVPLMSKFLFLPLRNDNLFFSFCIKYQLISYQKKANHSYRIPTIHEIQQKLEDSMLMLEV